MDGHEFCQLLEDVKTYKEALIQERSNRFVWVLQVADGMYSLGVGLPNREDFYERAGSAYLDVLKIDQIDFWEQYIHPCIVALGLMMITNEPLDKTYLPYTAVKCNGVRVAVLGFKT